MRHRVPSGPRLAIGAAAVLLITSVGLVLVDQDRDLRARGQFAAGTVIDNVVRDGGYHPVVRFETRDVTGAATTLAVTTFDCYERHGEPLYHAGDQVAVLYDPRRPDGARIHTTFGSWGLPVLCLLGAAFGILYALRAPAVNA